MLKALKKAFSEFKIVNMSYMKPTHEALVILYKSAKTTPNSLYYIERLENNKKLWSILDCACLNKSCVTKIAYAERFDTIFLWKIAYMRTGKLNIDSIKNIKLWINSYTEECPICLEKMENNGPSCQQCPKLICLKCWKKVENDKDVCCMFCRTPYNFSQCGSCKIIE